MVVRSDDPYIALCASKHHLPKFLIPIVKEFEVEHPNDTRVEYSELVP